MNKRAFIIALCTIGILTALHALAITCTNNFPTSLNGYTPGQCIPSADINALEAKIGANSSTATSSLDYKVSHVPTSSIQGLGDSAYYASSTFMKAANNGSDIPSTSTFRNTLGLLSAALHNLSELLQVANNLSDVNNSSTVRINLGMKATSSFPLADSNGIQSSSNLSQSGGTTLINGATAILDGGGDYIGPNIFMSTTSTVVLGNTILGGGVFTVTSSIELTPNQFCNGGLFYVTSTPSNATITIPTYAGIQSSTCGPLWTGQMNLNFLYNGSSNNVTQSVSGTRETFMYSPGTPNVLAPGQAWWIAGQFIGSSTVQGATTSILQINETLYQTSTPFTINGNAMTMNGSLSQSGGIVSLASTTITGNSTHAGPAVFQNSLTQSGGLASLASTTITGNVTTTNETITSFGEGLVHSNSTGVLSSLAVGATGTIPIVSSGVWATSSPLTYWRSTDGNVGSASLGVAGGQTNKVNLFGPLTVPVSIKGNSIQFNITTADTSSTDTYDLGLYDLNGNLIFNIGTRAITSTGIFNVSTTQGTITIPPGNYYPALTGPSTTLKFGGVTALAFMPLAGVQGSTDTTTSTLPATTTIQTPSYTSQNGMPAFSLHL